MLQHKKFLPAVLCGLVFTGTVHVLSAQTQTGEWILSRSNNQGPDNGGKVRFSLQSSRNGDHFSTSSDWNTSDFHGIDWSTSGKHDVRFTIARDAGTIEGEGFLKNGEGAGLFTFNPDERYTREMQSLGFSGISAGEQLAFAIHDVSLAFARQMKSLGIQGVDADKLMAFRIHGVSPQFINDLRAAGLAVSDADKLIAFRIHGVTPEYVRGLQRLGYSHPDSDQLVAMRIHGVTPEYIENLRSHGMRNLTLDQLVSLRIQGIN
ncbi:MAG: hypothetical protein ACR2IV_15170 [Bryobacteraceae bacterium]